MTRTTSKLTTALAGLAFASLPLLVDAQSTSTQSTQPSTPTQTRGTSSQQTRGSRSTDDNSAQQHLNEAKRVLTGINHRTMKGEAGTRISELKRHFVQLETTWRKSSASSARTGAARSTEEPRGSGTAGTSGAATGSTTTEQQSGTYGQKPRSGSASAMAGDNGWMTHYTAITSILDQLGATSSGTSAHAGTTSGMASGTGSAAGTTGSAAGTTGSASGTTGSAAGTTSGTASGTASGTGASASADVNVDASVRTKLVEFRRHLDLFHQTAMNQSGRGEEDAASANPHSGVTGAMTGTTGSATGTTGSATGTTGSATGTTGSATGTTGSATTSTTQYPATGSPESTMSATGTAGSMTSPQSTAPSPQTSSPSTTTSASSQAQPQPQTQTSASGRVDQAIARLTASIDELLRGSASTSTAAGTTTETVTGTAGSTSTGTVGTAGTTSATGTVCVDRAKLEQLRRDIQALQNQQPRQ